MEKAESVPEVVESIEKLLNKHQQELLQHLDSWADRVTSAYANAPLALGSLGTLAKKPTGGTFGALNCGEAPVVSGEDAEIAPKKNRKSYDEARLTHVQAMEARSEVELSRGFSEVKPFWHSWRHFRRFCKWLVESSWANTFFALLILSNSVFLGVQLEMQAAYQDVSIQLTVFAAFNVSYAVLFSLEVALRLLACGPSSYLWLSDEYVWNWLDVFVVFASWIELIIFFLTPGSTMCTNRNFRVLRLLRFGRIVRVVRIVRVARLFRSLRTLINSLVGTLKSLFWSLLLLALIMYMFGILFTDAVLDHRNELNFADETSNLSKFFGGLYPSIVTLFRSISNGLTWGEAADALENMDNGIFWSSLFHFYVAFCSFAVLNVMTGTFCNAAIKAAERDHDMLVLSLMQTRQELREQVANLFHRIDHHGSGQITITDFESHFSDDAVIAFFESLEIGAMDAWTLFLSLDVDGDHTISVDEFTERCLQLHGPARSADIFALRQNTDKLEEELMKVEARQLQLNQRFTEVIDTVRHQRHGRRGGCEYEQTKEAFL